MSPGELQTAYPTELMKEIQNVCNFTRLYSHQAIAIDHLLKGEHVIISTSTSSGKSLAYQLPILKSIYDDVNARALLIFPTKVLSYAKAF